MAKVKSNIRENPEKVLKTIAKSLDADIVEHQNQCELKIPEKKGEGIIRLFNFSYGVSLLIFNLKLKKKLKLYYDYEQIHPLKLNLLKKGSLTHSFEGKSNTNHIKEFESIIFASTPEEAHIFEIPKNKKIIALSIQINRKEFESKIEAFISEMDSDISKLFRDVNGINSFFYRSYYSPESINLINDILSGEKKQFTEVVNLEGLTYQLLTKILENLVLDRGISAIDNVSSKTKAKVHEAVEIIRNDIENYKSVKALAKQISINEKTLQAAFKKVYSCTVSKYVQDFRAKKAVLLMENTDLNISEIAYKLGFSSPGQLTKLYKSYYNCLPSEAKQKS